MSRTAALVAVLATGGLASAINVCASQEILNFRDFEPAKEYCAPHYPAQTIISTALPRCLTTTKTNIVATSTVTATKLLSCPAEEALSDIDQGEVPLAKRDPEAWGGFGSGWAGGWGGPGGWSGGGGGWGGPPSWPWGEGGQSSEAKPWWESEPWWQHGGYGEPWWEQGGQNGGGQKPWWVHGGGHEEHGEHGKGGKHHKKKFHHAKRCGSSGECGSGEHCFNDNKQWWHDDNSHWWFGGSKQGGQGHCVPPKHHQKPHPAPPPCPWHPKPNPWHPKPQPHPKPTGHPWHPNPPHHPTHPKPPPYYPSSSSSYPESLYPVPSYYHQKRDIPTPVKRDAIATVSAEWAQVSSSLLQCGYQCIQKACSCIAATTVEYHTPEPTCTSTKTKATVLHITTTMEVMPEHCEHNDLRKA